MRTFSATLESGGSWSGALPASNTAQAARLIADLRPIIVGEAEGPNTFPWYRAPNYHIVRRGAQMPGWLEQVQAALSGHGLREPFRTDKLGTPLAHAMKALGAEAVLREILNLMPEAANPVMTEGRSVMIGGPGGRAMITLSPSSVSVSSNVQDLRENVLAAAVLTAALDRIDGRHDLAPGAAEQAKAARMANSPAEKAKRALRRERKLAESELAGFIMGEGERFLLWSEFPIGPDGDEVSGPVALVTARAVTPDDFLSACDEHGTLQLESVLNAGWADLASDRVIDPNRLREHIEDLARSAGEPEPS